MKNVFDVLKERGFIKQTIYEDELYKMLGEESVPFYIGFDPTADSLHIGHCVPYCILRRFQQAGHKVILLMGGATACIGDPSGRNDLRSMLTKEQIKENVESIKKTLEVFLDFDGENPAEIVDNSEWFSKINYIDFEPQI